MELEIRRDIIHRLATKAKLYPEHAELFEDARLEIMRLSRLCLQQQDVIDRRGRRQPLPPEASE